jgi:hypothetical protein
MKPQTKSTAQLAAALDRLAEGDAKNPGGGDSELLAWAAAGLRAADRAYQRQFQRAERLAAELARRTADLAAERVRLIEANSAIRALEAVAGRPAPHSSEQTIEVDSKGNLRRVVSRPLPEGRPAGFS